jgi:large subunit ribosomal protein L23
MALFSRETKEKKEETSAPEQSSKKAAVVADRDFTSVILSPRITEKAVGANEKNVYTFIVRRDATKFTVADAVKALFKVTPVKVNIVNKSPRQFMSRSKGRVQSEKGMKKAYVYLKKGDRIDLV